MSEGITPSAALRDDHAGRSLWSACIDRLAQEIPEQQFNTWIRPLTASVAADGSRVVLAVANRFKLDWIRAQYAARISAVLEAVQGRPVTLELALAPREAPARTTPANRPVFDAVTDQALAELPEVAPAESAGAGAPKTRLNPALTFAS